MILKDGSIKLSFAHVNLEILDQEDADIVSGLVQNAESLALRFSEGEISGREFLAGIASIDASCNCHISAGTNHMDHSNDESRMRKELAFLRTPFGRALKEIKKALLLDSNQMVQVRDTAAIPHREMAVA